LSAPGAPQLGLIVARGRNGAIGRAGTLPWRLSSDLKGFKAATLGAPLITGRRNQDDIGRALPGRTTIVLTRDASWRMAGTLVHSSLDAALAAGRAVAGASGAPMIWIIGGADLYAQTLPLADVLRLTEVDAAPEADVFFPAFDEAEWEETGREAHPAGPKDQHAFVVRHLVRRRID
jgi:dihydrofolate reductase